MSTESKKVWVVGHKNPDTDSICAAISYAYLKNQSGDKKTYVAKRAGAVNEETRLCRFKKSNRGRYFYTEKSRTYERRDEVCPKIF